MERVIEELRIDDGSRRIHLSPGVPGAIIEGAKCFSLELCRKPSQFGNVPVDHWWMDVSSVYGQRNQPARNGNVIVELFWSLCLKEATVFHEEVQDSYILAKLLPHVRSNGARRIFADAVLTAPGRVGLKRPEMIAQLDASIRAHSDREMGIEDFRDETAKLLGPEIYSEEVIARYRQISEELLGEGRRTLQKWGPSGLAVPLAQWRQWMTEVGRRSGNELDKQVLDILSYEARAAMHRCYSATWCALLPHVAKKYGLTSETITFHRLWHLDQCQPSNDPSSLFHLFHGHVFALHPATALFSLCDAGCTLLGNWLEQPDSPATFQRLLHGIFVAVGDYARWMELFSFQRKRESNFVTGIDLDREYEEQVTRSKRRRTKRSSE